MMQATPLLAKWVCRTIMIPSNKTDQVKWLNIVENLLVFEDIIVIPLQGGKVVRLVIQYPGFPDNSNQSWFFILL